MKKRVAANRRPVGDTRMKNLDAMDRNILQALQENGRLTNTELADRINLS